MRRYSIPLMFLVIAIVCLAVAVFFRRNEPSKTTIAAPGGTIQAYNADTDALRTLGLSGHSPLAADEGMLFIFPAPGEYGFWMKDMLFPLDLVWIAADK